MKPKRVGYVKPKCECGECDIRVDEQSNNDYEIVPSNQWSTMLFHEIEVSCKSDGCSVRAVAGDSDGFTWVE